MQIYEFYISKIITHHLWFIWNQHIDQVPVGLLAQLVERCTGIAEVMGSNPVGSEFFFRSYFPILAERVDLGKVSKLA